MGTLKSTVLIASIKKNRENQSRLSFGQIFLITRLVMTTQQSWDYEINKINIMHQKKYVAMTSNYQSSIYFCNLFVQTD